MKKKILFLFIIIIIKSLNIYNISGFDCSVEKEEEDPYKVLEVSRNWRFEDIKLKFKQISLKCHPDRAKTIIGAKKYYKITKAYEQIKFEFDIVQLETQTQKFSWIRFVISKTKILVVIYTLFLLFKNRKNLDSLLYNFFVILIPLNCVFFWGFKFTFIWIFFVLLPCCCCCRCCSCTYNNNEKKKKIVPVIIDN